MKQIKVKTYYSLSNEIYKFRKAGFIISDEISGKKYTLTRGAEAIQIIKETAPAANNEKLTKALDVYTKLSKEATAAINAAKAADARQKELFSIWDEEATAAAKAAGKAKFLTIKECDNMQSWKDYKAADEATAKARHAERVAIIAREAAKANAAKAGAEVIREAIAANPEKYAAPVTSNKFLNAISEAVDNAYITIKVNYSSIYVELYKDYQSAQEFLTDKQDDGTADIDRILKRKPAEILDYKTIKAEAKKAIKDAEKIEAIQAEAHKKAEAIRDAYKSNIKYMLPGVDQFTRDRGTI